MARLDWRASVSLVGTVVKYLAATMLVPLAVAVVYGDDVVVFVVSPIVVASVGFALERIDDEPRDGAWGHDVAFLHPDSTGGVLVEFVEH